MRPLTRQICRAGRAHRDRDELEAGRAKAEAIDEAAAGAESVHHFVGQDRNLPGLSQT